MIGDDSLSQDHFLWSERPILARHLEASSISIAGKGLYNFQALCTRRSRAGKLRVALSISRNSKIHCTVRKICLKAIGFISRNQAVPYDNQCGWKDQQRLTASQPAFLRFAFFHSSQFRLKYELLSEQRAIRPPKRNENWPVLRHPIQE